jgi:hypothetical protein
MRESFALFGCVKRDDVSDEAAERPPASIIEHACSSRSTCKTCGRVIARGTLRIGMRIEDPYGTGYMGHHLWCAARHQFAQVEDAYAEAAWRAAKNPPDKVPSLDEIRGLQAEADQRRKEWRALPYAERASSIGTSLGGPSDRRSSPLKHPPFTYANLIPMHLYDPLLRHSRTISATLVHPG